MDEEGKAALLLGKGMESTCKRVMEDVGECVLYNRLVDGSREGSNCCMGRLLLDIGPPLVLPLTLLEQLDTVYSF